MTERRGVAVVTGASSGVGRATARLFAEKGYDVALVARNRAALEAARAEVRARGRRACAVACDVSDAAGLDAAAATVEELLGPIDVWVNSAMVSVFSPAAELAPEELRRVTEVTYLGAVFGTLAALKRMRPRGRGVIVQVGSALAYRGIPLQSAYCGAKHALQGFNEALRCELLHEGSGVRTIMVNLPAVNTPHFDVVRTRLPGRPRPVAPVYQPEVAARAVLAAATRVRRRELNVGVMSSAAILGSAVAGGLADRWLARTGYASQQSPEPVEPGRADNLFAPPERDLGARGRFDPESASRSPHLAFELHRGAWLAALAVAAACLAWRRP